MPSDTIPRPRELANKPLVEAIFELRWAIKESSDSPSATDPGYQIALGRYYDRVHNDYPVAVNLPTSQIPEDMTAYAVRHQFRKAEDGWPVTQIGPGILTVNETAGYSWSTYKPRVLSAIQAMYDSYPETIAQFKPIGVQLRYIDAIPYDPNETDLTHFITEKLHTKIELDPLFCDSLNRPEKPDKFNLNLSFSSDNPSGTGSLTFSTGLRANKPCILLDTFIRSDAQQVPQQSDHFSQWLDSAHDVVVNKWFFTLIRGDLLSLFEGRDAK